jgi:hypothetical protein
MAPRKVSFLTRDARCKLALRLLAQNSSLHPSCWGPKGYQQYELAPLCTAILAYTVKYLPR